VYGDDLRVQRFEEKPLVREYWINAGFMVFERDAFLDWRGNNLERDVLPHFAERRELGVYRHDGFWKSMDTGKDQQELEELSATSPQPWMVGLGS
jgi:glucose-1-phosphate cytidylyltransferase